jgi:hypothetical protein
MAASPVVFGDSQLPAEVLPPPLLEVPAMDCYCYCCQSRLQERSGENGSGTDRQISLSRAPGGLLLKVSGVGHWFHVGSCSAVCVVMVARGFVDSEPEWDGQSHGGGRPLEGQTSTADKPALVEDLTPQSSECGRFKAAVPVADAHLHEGCSNEHRGCICERGGGSLPPGRRPMPCRDGTINQWLRATSCLWRCRQDLVTTKTTTDTPVLDGPRPEQVLCCSLTWPVRNFIEEGSRRRSQSWRARGEAEFWVPGPRSLPSPNLRGREPLQMQAAAVLCCSSSDRAALPLLNNHRMSELDFFSNRRWMASYLPS